jgi:NHL repeat
MPIRLLRAAAAAFLLASLTASAQITTTVATGLHRPTWLDVDRGNGNIYVVDRLTNTVQKIAGVSVTPVQMQHSFVDPSPVTLDFGGPFGGGIALEPSGAGCGGGPYGYGFFVSSSAQQQVVFGTDAGMLAARDDVSPILTFGFNNPTGLALSWGYVGRMVNGNTNDTDHLYIADTGNHRIVQVGYVISFEGCPQPNRYATLASGFVEPRGVAAAPDGSVYVTDSGDGTIRRILPDGRVVLAAEHLQSPSGIDVDADGNVYFADTGSATIRRLAPDGTIAVIAGTPGVAGFADGATALFNGPVGIRLAGQSIYVADTGNNAVRRIFLSTPPRRRAM